MKLTVLKYQCDNCGLCCTHTHICATTTDADREPRIKSECRRIKRDGAIQNLYLLNTEEGKGPCTFHTGTGCGIYATRPHVCVGFQAGSEDCQYLRREFGKPPLVAVPVEEHEAYVTITGGPLDTQPVAD